MELIKSIEDGTITFASGATAEDEFFVTEPLVGEHYELRDGTYHYVPGLLPMALANVLNQLVDDLLFGKLVEERKADLKKALIISIGKKQLEEELQRVKSSLTVEEASEWAADYCINQTLKVFAENKARFGL